MSVLVELRRYRADRLEMGRGPLWWAKRSPTTSRKAWLLARYFDFRVWILTVLVCGTRGHAWGVVGGLPELGLEPYICCARCGEDG